VERVTHPQASAVEQVALQLGAAFNGRDPAALAALYTENAVLMPPSEPSVQGTAAIEAWFTEALSRLGAIRLNPTGTHTAGSLAVQLGTFRIQPSSSALADGAAAERAGKYLLVLTRSGGEWKIYWDIWNLDQGT
jgi:ketosteroid isomerase-like protein